ncbi:hypothetical protein T09_13381 [Trichinella sp. T9]|nr:hypothetical protein T09_13381 [Trichinella sp. T9]
MVREVNTSRHKMSMYFFGKYYKCGIEELISTKKTAQAYHNSDLLWQSAKYHTKPLVTGLRWKVVFFWQFCNTSEKADIENHCHKTEVCADELHERIFLGNSIRCHDSRCSLSNSAKFLNDLRPVLLDNCHFYDTVRPICDNILHFHKSIFFRLVLGSIFSRNLCNRSRFRIDLSLAFANQMLRHQSLDMHQLRSFLLDSRYSQCKLSFPGTIPCSTYMSVQIRLDIFVFLNCQFDDTAAE